MSIVDCELLDDLCGFVLDDCVLVGVDEIREFIEEFWVGGFDCVDASSSLSEETKGFHAVCDEFDLVCSR